MYVQWLLEFVWRIFIQGPLMFINFLTNPNNLDKLSQTVLFHHKDSFASIASLFSVSIIIGFSLLFFLSIFIYKLIKIVIKANGVSTKLLLIDAFKNLGKSFVLIVMFTICFQVASILFDALLKVFTNQLNSYSSSGDGNKINGIADTIYKLITNESPDKNNLFLFPSENFLTKMDSINWIVSIAFCLTFSWFLIWLVWSLFQKMLEIYFLYLSFPISIAFSLESNQINYRVWIKEIINKVALVFLLMFLLRVFLHMFYLINHNLISNKWGSTKDSKPELYVSFFITLALGGSIMFLCKFISIKHQENIGIIASFKSFAQTRSFINNNKSEIIYHKADVDLTPINENINSLKQEISRSNLETINYYKNLDKVKIFNQ